TGPTTVTCTATDASGNSNLCNFTVTIRDAEPPKISCPPNQIVRTCDDRAQVTYTATATDNCDASVTVVCNPPSGSFFPVGTSTVNCQASDKAGNKTE